MLKPLKTLKHLSAAIVLFAVTQAHATQPQAHQAQVTAQAPFSTPAYVTELNFALFDDSGWTTEQVQEQVKELQGVFSQCQLGVSSVRTFRMHAPLGSGNLDKNKDDFKSDKSYARLAEQAKDLPRPLVFLVKGFDPNKSLDYPFSRALFYNGTDNEVYPQAILDTVWFPYSVNLDLDKVASRFDVLAHELTHLLTLDSDHNGDNPANLMSDSMRRTNVIPEYICKQIVASRFVQPNPASLIATLINLDLRGRGN